MEIYSDEYVKIKNIHFNFANTIFKTEGEEICRSQSCCVYNEISNSFAKGDNFGTPEICESA